jgi:hypothetical protein
MKSFYGMEAVLNMVMLAYNLMSLFRQVILQEKTQPKLSTLRYRLFAIGGYDARRKPSYLEIVISNEAQGVVPGSLE